MFPWIVLLFSLSAWGMVWIWFDTPATPLWVTRRAYRYLIFTLIQAIFLLAWKSSLLHTELVTMIAISQ